MLARHARLRATKRGLSFNLYDHLPELQARIDRGFCELTGLPFNLDGGRTWDSPSFDRKIPSKGYVISNIRVVCHAVNSGMGDWGEQKLIEIAQAILKMRKRKSNTLSEMLGEKLKQKATGSVLYRVTWKKQVTASGALIYRLRASKARISASDFILSGWPTTTTRDHKDGASEGTAPINALLGRQVWLSGWPTTNATDSTGPGRQGRDGGANLQTAAAAETQMPSGRPMRLCSDGSLLTGCSAGMESGGRLNPAHSRWLMRLPPEWDACVPLETQSTRKPRQPSVKPSATSAMEYDL